MKRLSRALIVLFLVLSPLAAQAQLKLLPPCATTSNIDGSKGPTAGNCTITDILVVFANVAELLLGIVGAVALGYFVYGGFRFILSRGDKGEVGAAVGILRSATIGIFIIFLSGVLVRFTTQALTGGQSKIPTVGETCKSGPNAVSDPNGDGLWILMPEGISQSGVVMPQSLVCIKKEQATPSAEQLKGTKTYPCTELNKELENRQRKEVYNCIDTGKATTTCVRGLCAKMPAQYACCLQP